MLGGNIFASNTGIIPGTFSLFMAHTEVMVDLALCQPLRKFNVRS
jgi:hypothetical protein